MQNIDIYYESLKQVNDQIILWREQQEKKKPSLINRLVEALRNAFVVLFIISVIPILPALFAYIASRTSFVLGILDLTQPTLQNFLKVWAIIGIITGLLFLLLEKINDSLSTKTIMHDEKPRQSLSPEQYTFIRIYQSYKELKMFFIDHFDQHIENSLNALRSTLISGRSRFFDIPYEYMSYEEAVYYRFAGDRPNGTGLMEQIQIAGHFMRVFEQYDWFMLDSKTKSILQALVSFSEKILQRIESREELPGVLEVLENLSKYIYAFLPEHKTYMNAEILGQLHAQGFESLSRFVEKANNMTLYQLPKKEDEIKNKLSPSTMKDKFINLYQNIFFRFALWSIILLILTLTMVFGASQVLTLSPDTMATVIIGTSVGGAAALATFLPRYPITHKKESTEESESTKGAG